jgi:hypothetical protein
VSGLPRHGMTAQHRLIIWMNCGVVAIVAWM